MVAMAGQAIPPAFIATKKKTPAVAGAYFQQPDQSKKIPLITAFAPPVLVTVITTCPEIFHSAYTPSSKLANDCVLNTALLLASLIVIVSLHRSASQSSRYNEILCVFPSVRFRFTDSLVPAPVP
jgi:hypothetical protein